MFKLYYKMIIYPRNTSSTPHSSPGRAPRPAAPPAGSTATSGNRRFSSFHPAYPIISRMSAPRGSETFGSSSTVSTCDGDDRSQVRTGLFIHDGGRDGDSPVRDAQHGVLARRGDVERHGIVCTEDMGRAREARVERTREGRKQVGEGGDSNPPAPLSIRARRIVGGRHSIACTGHSWTRAPARRARGQGASGAAGARRRSPT
ncbi:hypothetical protein B0H10DRAFT_1079836 [Mycena sp. CBHHK59/15]|nr:hypothetical protein B0H10DRAFT_1079836 [Mycena sp. CBHHK59/15]